LDLTSGARRRRRDYDDARSSACIYCVEVRCAREAPTAAGTSN